MNGFSLMIPFLLIRFGMLAFLGKNGMQRAAHYAPVFGKEKAAYWIYQLSTAGIFGYLCFLKIEITVDIWFTAGIICYVSGLVLCAVSLIHFATWDDGGLNTKGIYRFSRHPVYVAYFVCFLGMSLLTGSLVLAGVVLVFQISCHWIILAEERECISRFGDDYKKYMEKVRRYI